MTAQPVGRSTDTQLLEGGFSPSNHLRACFTNKKQKKALGFPRKRREGFVAMLFTSLTSPGFQENGVIYFAMLYAVCWLFAYFLANMCVMGAPGKLVRGTVAGSHPSLPANVQPGLSKSLFIYSRQKRKANKKKSRLAASVFFFVVVTIISFIAWAFHAGDIADR